MAAKGVTGARAVRRRRSVECERHSPKSGEKAAWGVGSTRGLVPPWPHGGPARRRRARVDPSGGRPCREPERGHLRGSGRRRGRRLHARAHLGVRRAAERLGRRGGHLGLDARDVRRRLRDPVASVIVPQATTLQAGQHYLIASPDLPAPTADLELAEPGADSLAAGGGGVRVSDSLAAPVDVFGYGDVMPPCFESATESVPPANSSAERQGGGRTDTTTTPPTSSPAPPRTRRTRA